MTIQTMVLIMASLFVAMAWWANNSKRDKIYCSFTRKNKTSIHRFVRMSSQYVVYAGGRYNVVPSCIVFDWWDKGIVGMFFPQWVATLDYTEGNPFPKDPKTLQPVVLSAEVRQTMNKEETFRAYNRSFTPQGAKKQTFIQEYLPYITILLLVMMGVYFYMNMQNLGKGIDEALNQIRAIAR